MQKPGYRLPETYHLGSQGCGCAGEPPGHPRYFTRSIYTGHGNSPPRSSQPQYECKGRYYTKLEDVDKYFKLLPLEHPRTQEWINDLFRHLHHCYHDPDNREGHPTLIYPVPDYKLKQFRDDERFSEEWREKEQAAINQANHDILARAGALATPDNHSATRAVRKHYPDFTPTPELIDSPPQYPGNWWTTEAERPTPETCPGQYRQKHPVNVRWCQWCGWREDD